VLSGIHRRTASHHDSSIQQTGARRVRLIDVFEGMGWRALERRVRYRQLVRLRRLLAIATLDVEGAELLETYRS
jgi:hypothetical protein